MKNLVLNVAEDDELIRIDTFLSANIEDKSRSYIQKLIKESAVLVNGKEIKPNYIVHINDEISIKIPDDVIPDIVSENIDIDIVYEDEDILIVNKQKDMVVHPAPGHYSGTLVNAIMYHCKDKLSGINGVLRPGIVHRIDKDTTGLLVICKNDIAHETLAKQFKEHTITRAYRAIVFGNLKEDEGVINKPLARSKNDRKKMSIDLNGKTAITHYKVLARFSKYTYIECILETGRTHQIRVHMSSIGHPLLGDEIYSKLDDKMNLQGQCLHAISLGFIHPRTKEYIEFKSDLPEYFEKILKKLS